MVPPGEVNREEQNRSSPRQGIGVVEEWTGGGEDVEMSRGGPVPEARAARKNEERSSDQLHAYKVKHPALGKVELQSAYNVDTEAL